MLVQIIVMNETIQLTITQAKQEWFGSIMGKVSTTHNSIECDGMLSDFCFHQPQRDLGILLLKHVFLGYLFFVLTNQPTTNLSRMKCASMQEILLYGKNISLKFTQFGNNEMALANRLISKQEHSKSSTKAITAILSRRY